MINRRNCFHLLSITYNHHLRNRHCRRFCSMAAAASTFSISCKDPFRNFSGQKNSLAAAAGSSTVELSTNGSGRGRCIGLRLKGCCSSENSSSSCKNNYCNKTSGFNNNNAGGSGFELHKARAISPSLPQQLFRELESEVIGLHLTNNGADGGGACQGGRGSYLQSFRDRSLSEKIMVAVDVDEVLGNFVSALNQFIADRYSSNHSVSEYHVYEFFKIWNCSRDEADMRVHEFFKTAYFKKGIHPIPGALQALQKLSRYYSLSIVTSRQNAIKGHTIAWIEKHYPGLFQEIHFGNHFALDGQSRPKSEICRSLGAKVLIDDNPRYAIECAEVGIRVLLFDYENSYPWCKSVKQHPLVTKVHNWEEVEHQLVSDEILTAMCDI